MGLPEWVAKKWAKRKLREIMRQAFPGGVMSESLKKSLKKAGAEAGRTVLAAALGALAIWAVAPDTFNEIVEAVPAAALFVPLIQMIARSYLDQRKHNGKRGAGTAAVIGLVCLGLAAPAYAATRHYNEVVSATQANSAVTFSDSAGAFYANSIALATESGDSPVVVNLKSTTATYGTNGIIVPPGLTVNVEWDGGDPGGWSGLGAICDTGETATLYVTAVRQ
jgi:hypothetical protein